MFSGIFPPQLSYSIVLTCWKIIFSLKRLIQLIWEVGLMMLARHLKSLPSPTTKFIIYSFIGSSIYTIEIQYECVLRSGHCVQQMWPVWLGWPSRH